jgi:hypothetical protein
MENFTLTLFEVLTQNLQIIRLICCQLCQDDSPHWQPHKVLNLSLQSPLLQLLKKISNITWKSHHISQCCIWRIPHPELMESMPLQYWPNYRTVWALGPGTVVLVFCWSLSPCVSRIWIGVLFSFIPSVISFEKKHERHSIHWMNEWAKKLFSNLCPVHILFYSSLPPPASI